MHSHNKLDHQDTLKGVVSTKGTLMKQPRNPKHGDMMPVSACARPGEGSYETPVDDKIKEGDEFGKWTVRAYKGKNRTQSKTGHWSVTDQWLCWCQCGKAQLVLRWNLLSNHTTQCRVCHRKELGAQRKLSMNPDSRRQNSSISGKYRRIQDEGCLADWDWLSFLSWFRALDQSKTSGSPCRIDPDKPHGPENTYFLKNPIRASHLAIIAEMSGMTAEDTEAWANTVSRQAVGQRANALRAKKASA